MKKTDKKINEIMLKKETLKKCLDNANKELEMADSSLKRLIEEKGKLCDKKSQETNKVFKNFLKRKQQSVDLDEDIDEPKKQR